MKWVYSTWFPHKCNVQEYRKYFLKRKNINCYKPNKNTPILLDKLLNTFDRKIKGIPIFKDDIKKEYLKGVQDVFNQYYDTTFEPKKSRKQAYYEYEAEIYCIYKGQVKAKTFKEFKKSGLFKYYK